MTRTLRYAGLAAATTALGLASRHWTWPGKYPGDVLYAVLAYWLLRGVGLPRRGSAGGAFALASLVELAKLWHAPWLEAWRATRLGGLVLGHGFLWADVGCYLGGAAVAYWLDRDGRVVSPEPGG